MSIKIWIDGVIHPPETAVVPVFDRGFLYGDSVYEVTRTAGGRPVDLGPHLDRLARSAGSIALPLPPRADIERAVAATLAAAGNPDSYIRIVITRGAGEIGLDISLADRSRTVVIVKPLELPAARLYRDGAPIWIVDVQRVHRRAVDPAVKSGNYLNNILALAEARQAGAYEAIMCDSRGRIAEGSTSNLFIVRGGRLATPHLEVGLLAGITRQTVMQLAAGAGLPVDEAELVPDDVRGADEAFLTSSVRGVMPVGTVDGRPLGSGVPGPVTARILELYDHHLAEAARS